MTAWKYNNLGFRMFFALAIIVHAVLILVPVTKRMVATVNEQPSVQVQLISPAPTVEAKQPPEPQVEWPKLNIPVLEELPPFPIAEPPVRVQAVVQQTPERNRARMLSSQFDYKDTRRNFLSGPVEKTDDSPDFYIRQRTSLEMALNQPSLQLPFEDSRIYLVDSYDAGFMGGMDRFWDTVSVPFGFTTKNNTRVQCVWVLVIAGCGWGHKTLFYRSARHREEPKEQPVKKSEFNQPALVTVGR